MVNNFHEGNTNELRILSVPFVTSIRCKTCDFKDSDFGICHSIRNKMNWRGQKEVDAV
jgi:hypothetical protein